MVEQVPPFCGADLERWRVGVGMTRAMAAETFGIPRAKWDELTSVLRSSKPIEDPVVAMLLQLFIAYPESAPVQPPADIKGFYAFLGLSDTPRDRELFATLIGRSQPTVIRLLLHDGKPSRSLMKWVDAIRRLKLSPKRSQKVMAEMVSAVGSRQRIDNVLIDGWRRPPDSGDDE